MEAQMVRYDKKEFKKIKGFLEDISKASSSDSKPNNIEGDLSGQIEVPFKFHEQVQLLQSDIKQINSEFLKKISKGIMIEVKAIELVAEQQKSPTKNRSSYLSELRDIENELFKNVSNYQNELKVINDSIALQKEKVKSINEIEELQNQGFMTKFKNRAKIEKLNNKVKEINIAIQNNGEALSVNEVLNSQKNSLVGSIDSTVAVSDLVRKTIEKVSQIEHVPTKQFSNTRTNIQQLER